MEIKQTAQSQNFCELLVFTWSIYPIYLAYILLKGVKVPTSQLTLT